MSRWLVISQYLCADSLLSLMSWYAVLTVGVSVLSRTCSDTFKSCFKGAGSFGLTHEGSIESSGSDVHQRSQDLGMPFLGNSTIGIAKCPLESLPMGTTAPIVRK